MIAFNHDGDSYEPDAIKTEVYRPTSEAWRELVNRGHELVEFEKQLKEGDRNDNRN
jgi:hypothetical protein